tara:strand:+ start:451 stop:795 length:345 start_codon:yes stop_codon:yes gene_type:complete
MNLWDRIEQIIYGSKLKNNQTEEAPKVNLDREKVQLAVYECPYKKGPTASVRFTTYHEDGKAFSVEQINYPGTPEGLVDLDYQVTTAIELGLDVSILTNCDVTALPKLSQYTAT